MVVNAGEDLKKSILMMINKLSGKYEVPNEWKK